jgi:predicted membrane protein
MRNIMPATRNSWFGILLIVFGVFFILDATTALDVGGLFTKTWPVLLILVGGYLLFRRRLGSIIPRGNDQSLKDDDSVDVGNFIGDLTLRVTSPSFRGGSASTVLGKVRVDCREGGLADGEHRLVVSSVSGSVTVLLPKGAAAMITASAVVGGTAVFDQSQKGVAATLIHESPDFASAAKKLRVEASVVFGEVTVL